MASQQKWENLYPCLFYSASKQGWLCKVCGEYSDHGDAFWRTEAVKMGEHSGRLFSEHMKSDKHSKALKKVHVWAGISKRGPTNIAIFTGIMRKEFYVDEILQNLLLPFLQKVFPDNHRFQQDDPKHTSKFLPLSTLLSVIHARPDFHL